ncbi:MAG TPA: DUF445 domain-containing protein [Stellaceae bacterium]|nr:DUF445 domain-containing protein [Stellaceae bacterium]
MSIWVGSGIEASQRAALRRNKRRATLLLLAVASIFLATTAAREVGFWLLLLRAAAEAAVVGALADWFAVTAVFRRPLGLPIPHTAIVPRNQDRIGEGLGSFVAANFLTPGLLAEKLRQIDVAARIAAFLGEEAQAERLAERIVALLPYVIRSLEDEDIRNFAARALGEQLREADLAAAFGKSLGTLTQGAPFDTVFDRALDGLRRTVEREQGTIYRLVEERTAWWIPRAIDRRIAGAIMAAIAEFLTELRRPESRRRRALRARLAKLARDLVSSPPQRERFDALKNQLLDQPAVAAWLGAAWDALRAIVLDDLASPRSRTREALARGFCSLGRALAADEAMRARLNAAIEEAAVKAVVPWRNEIGRFISEVVRGWETRTVVERLELALGSDLQYIRITGTLVGACVGCLLFLLSALLG